MSKIVSLSQAKARFSEVVRTVRTDGEEWTVTVDGQSAVRIVPIRDEMTPLTDMEVATFRTLMKSVGRIPRPEAPFDAVDLVRSGRR